MGKQLRVHTLAKELSVSSKDILEKCRAEGIELNNHMAAISAGLAESIREWFSVGEDVTSIETAAPVDLKRVRKRKPKAAPAESPAAPPAEDSAGGVTTAEAEPEAPAEVVPTHRVEARPEAEIAERAAAEAETPAAAEAPAEPSAVPEPVEPALAGPEPIAASAATEAAPPAEKPVETEGPTADEGAGPEPEKPSAPAPAEPPTTPKTKPAPPPVRPAGPQVVPRPAELQGPRVVRIEAPEPVRTPRPRPAPMQPLAPAASDAGPAAPQRGRGKKTTEEEREAAKTRARSPRRHGRGADVMERMREWRDQDVIERRERLASATGHRLRDRRAVERRRQATSPAAPGEAARKAPIEIVAPLAIKDFCAAAGVPFSSISGKLLEHTGKLMTINQLIDAETAELLVMDLGLPVKIAAARTALEILEEEYRTRERTHAQPRPPVVAMLGHVDHGKTSLLDAIRRTRVAAGEAGGITQHIGAYRLTRGDWDVTFLDTPGHEAFTAMRARGAQLTDVVVLVVAADDGVMPQTVEAINHAKAAGVTIVVALNKIDLPNANPDRVYGQLSEHELVPTEWGGNIDVIKTSATSGKGIDELIAHLSTLSELLNLTADPTVPAAAAVIEAQMREGRGVVAQVLVRDGTLRVGQTVVCGPASGRIRSLTDDSGRRVKEATPGTPVEVGGLDELPGAGDMLYVVDSLARAKEVADEVRNRRRQQSLTDVRKPQTLEDLLRSEQESEIPELNVIIKADGQASVDALKSKLAEFPADKARLRILHAGVGAVSEADVTLAHTSSAVIFGFYVVADDRARQMADQLGVEIRLYRVIYEILDDVHKALEGLLAPEQRQEARGRAEVKQVFNISRVGTIAGCQVRDGVINRNHRVRLVRDGRVVLEGAGIASLKRVKDDAREVRAGLECGIKIEGFDDVKPGDLIETFEVVEVAQRL